LESESSFNAREASGKCSFAIQSAFSGTEAIFALKSSASSRIGSCLAFPGTFGDVENPMKESTDPEEDSGPDGGDGLDSLETECVRVLGVVSGAFPHRISRNERDRPLSMQIHCSC